MNSDNDTGYKEQPRQPPAAPAVLPRDGANQRSEQAGSREKKKRDYGDVRFLGFPLLDVFQSVFNLVLVLTAVFGSCYVHRQLGIMEQQQIDSAAAAKVQDEVTTKTLRNLKDQADALKRQADALGNLVVATTSAADAAKVSADNSARIAESSGRSVVATQASLRLDERAWLILDSISSGKPTAGEPFLVKVHFRNTGRTPALKVQIADTVDFGHPVFTYRQGQIIELGVLYPNTTIETALFQDVFGKLLYTPTDKDIAAINNHTTTIYAHGRVTYEDIFHRKHWLNFCHFYQPVSGIYGICETHNETDKD